MNPQPDTRPANPGTIPKQSQEHPEGKDTRHRGKGKIAQLPKALRDEVNSMLDDGIAYARIIARIQQADPPVPYSISPTNISRWKDNGYQRYLAHQHCLTELRGNRDDAQEMVAKDDTTTLPEATLQIIASHYYELLRSFSPTPLKAKLAEDPIVYTRFINVFARLTREILNLKKNRDAAAQAAAAELKALDPNRKLSDSEDALLSDITDNFLLTPRRVRPAAIPNPSNATAEPVPTPL